jgi:hypothetical protein
MKILQSVFRLYVSDEAFEKTISFYERSSGPALRTPRAYCRDRCDRRQGRRLSHLRRRLRRPRVRHVDAIFYVDSLDEFFRWLPENGAELLHAPRTVTAGRNATVRNPDGLVVEYFEAAR